jgi:type II secretory pathway component PulK
MKGYMAIVTVLVILAVTGGIAAALTFLSIDANQAEQSRQRGNQARLFSEACLEAGYLDIVRDQNYSGSNFQMPEGECQVTVALDNGTYTVHALGKGEAYERSVSGQVVMDPDKLRVVSWKEE